MRRDSNVVAMAAALHFLPHAAASMQSQRLARDEAHPQYRLGQIRSGAHADTSPQPLIALVLVLRNDLRSLAWLQGLVDSERAKSDSVV